jgi:hypothetical protein
MESNMIATRTLRSGLAGVAALLATLTGAAQVGGPYDLSWSTIDGGGWTFSTGGTYSLGGTIGQPDAGVMSGGPYTLQGGFWPGASAPAVLRGDMNCDGFVNNFDIDPFVLALSDPNAYQIAYPGCNPQNGDINEDGLVNNFDIDPFVLCITNGGCP